MSQSLAVKYRPKTFDDVVEQDAIKIILQQQIQSGNIQHSYLFCGGAGTGKTTCARIFANEINHHQGVPIEIDAASNSGVDDVREVIKQAQSKSLDSEYKIFIIDETHSLSNTAWQAFLKLLEEPPAKSIFIFATTDPQKIPKTILSRVQRYDFSRISQKGIVDRLRYICDREVTGEDGLVRLEALEYLCKIADGGMRDAITLLDKCLAYSKDLTLKNVIKALGTVDYAEMFEFLKFIVSGQSAFMLKKISDVYYSGKDLKLFIKQFTNFVLDVIVYDITESPELVQIPSMYADELREYKGTKLSDILAVLVKLNSELKWETSPKSLIEATLLLEAIE